MTKKEIQLLALALDSAMVADDANEIEARLVLNNMIKRLPFVISERDKDTTIMTRRSLFLIRGR